MAEDTTKFTVETDDLTGSLNKATKAIKEESAAAGTNSKIVKDNAQQIKNLSTAQKMTAGTAKTLGASMATANNVTNLFSESSGTLTGFMGNLIPVLGGVTKGIKGITLAIKANPIGFVIASLMAVIALFNPIVNGIKKVTTLIVENFTENGRAIKALRTFNEEMDKQIVKLNQWADATKKAIDKASEYYDIGKKQMVTRLIEAGASSDEIEKAIAEKTIQDNKSMLANLNKSWSDYRKTYEDNTKKVQERLHSARLGYVATMTKEARKTVEKETVAQVEALEKRQNNLNASYNKAKESYVKSSTELKYSTANAERNISDIEKKASDERAKKAKDARDEGIKKQRDHNKKQIEILKENRS